MNSVQIQISEPKAQENTGLNTAIEGMVKNNEQIVKTVRTVMTRTDYSPDRLLQVQYDVSVLLLHQQLLCRTAELGANTFKNFLQMQI